MQQVHLNKAKRKREAEDDMGAEINTFRYLAPTRLPTPTHPLELALTHLLKRSDTRTHTRTLPCSHTRTHTRTLHCSHTRTHTRSLALFHTRIHQEP